MNPGLPHLLKKGCDRKGSQQQLLQIDCMCWMCAQKREEAAIEELYKMYQLKTSVFRVRTNQHKLILYMDQPKRWQEQYTLLVNYVDQARQVWFEFKTNYSIENPNLYDSVIEQNEHES